jgi:hypothetical protein
VPYVNHYFNQPLSDTNHLWERDFSSSLLNFLIHVFGELFIDGVIKGSDPSIVEELLQNVLIAF